MILISAERGKGCLNLNTDITPGVSEPITRIHRVAPELNTRILPGAPRIHTGIPRGRLNLPHRTFPIGLS